jgi:hypothetical protein
MTAVAILSEALARGGRLLWDPPQKPRLLIPTALRAQLDPERETVREVIRRATIFRQQALAFIQPGQALPILALPERPEGEGCLSCGIPIDAGHYRCDMCALAVNLALEGTP